MRIEYTVVSKMRSEGKQTNDNLITNNVSEIHSSLSCLTPSHQKKKHSVDGPLRHISKKHAKNLDQNEPQAFKAVNGILEVNFKNSISPSEKKTKRQKNYSVMNNCEDRVTLSKGKREQRNQSNIEVIDLDSDSSVEKSAFTSSPEKKKRKREVIHCEGDELKLKERKKKKKKTPKQSNQNATVIYEFEQNLSFPSPIESVENYKRKKKHRRIQQNESSANQDEVKSNSCVYEREPPFAKTSQNIEQNKSVLNVKENKNIRGFSNLSTCKMPKMSKEDTKTQQSELKVGHGRVNTQLIESRSDFSQLLNREYGAQKEIDSVSPMLTSKKRKKRRECGYEENVAVLPELGSNPSSQPLQQKRKIKKKHREKNTSHNCGDERLVSNFCTSESEPYGKSIGTNRQQIENNIASSMVYPKENRLIKDITFRNVFENSSSSEFPSSFCDETEKNINENINELNTDSDDECIFDIFGSDSEKWSSMDLLNSYAKKLGNKKEECDKIWDDAVAAEFGGSALQKCCEVDVKMKHDVHLLHLVDCSFCALPTKEQRDQLILMGMKQTPFNKSEDAIIMKNWNDLCEDNGVSPSVLLVKVIKRIRGNRKTKRRIVQYLGNGLPDRALYQIYHRFILLSSSKRGQFTEEEDYILLKAVNSQVKEKYALLSKILMRSRNTIYKRHQSLLTYLREGKQVKKNKRNFTFASKVVKSLMCITKASSIEVFKNSIITTELWRQVENDINVPHWQLLQFWVYKLYVQLFADTPVCKKEVQKKIVEWLYQKNYSTEKEIEWSESLHLISGSTSSFMWLQFRGVKRKFQFKNFKSLRDFIKAVYAQKNAFDGPSRYLIRYKVNDDFSLTIINDEGC